MLPTEPSYAEACNICEKWMLPQWQPSLDAIIAQHQLDVLAIEQNLEGANPVFMLLTTDKEHLVLKLIAPLWQSQFDSECYSLQQLQAQPLGIKTPQLRYQGQYRGWYYLIQERLDGITLDKVLPQMTIPERCHIAIALGQFAKHMHQQPIPTEHPLNIDWRAFLTNQLKICVDKRRRQGLTGPLLSDLPRYLARHSKGLFTAEFGAKIQLTHTDLHPGNLLVQPSRVGYQLTGIIDFGDALACPDITFEFTSVAMLLALGNARVFHAFLDGYQYQGPRDNSLQRHLMMLSLLRHTGDLNYLLNTVPGCHEMTRWSDLEAKFFPISD